MSSLLTKIQAIDDQILAGKTAIADALLQVGITAVEPNPNAPDTYEIFQSYADKIKRLMISNSLILEYDVTGITSASTLWQRSLVLPVNSNIGVGIDDIMMSIVEQDKSSQNIDNQRLIGGGALRSPKKKNRTSQRSMTLSETKLRMAGLR